MKKDFLEVYEQLCAVHDCCPLRAITDRLRDSLIDCHADRIQYEEWGPILNALKCKNSLRLIAFRSFWQPSRELKGIICVPVPVFFNEQKTDTGTPFMFALQFS